MKKLTIALALTLALVSISSSAVSGEFQEMLPYGTHIGNECIEYCLYRAKAEVVTLSVVMVALWVVAYMTYRKFKKAGFDIMDSNWGVACAISCSAWVVSLLAFSCSVYELILANHNPMAYAISQVFGK